MITGLSHITLIVKDLERTAGLLRTVFDAEEIYSSGEKTFSASKEKYLLIGSVWICIMEGEPLTERTYNHIAFKINDEDFDSYLERIKSAEIKPGRPRQAGEGRSIYFYDYDNHLFELHTGCFEDRLAFYNNK